MFTVDGNVTGLGRKICLGLVLLYALVIALFCFLPQNVYPTYKDFSTPGIIQVGRLYFLLTPFNSIVNAHQVESLGDFGWIIFQNAINVFLIFPLVFLLLLLFERWRKLLRVLQYSFGISLAIELTQLLLDVLIDAQRVFEIDDLWTNTLGGLLAYACYRLFMKYVVRSS